MQQLSASEGLIATALGVVGIVAVVSLAVFFIVAGPFGSINDWSIGLMGVLTALFVLAARGGDGRSPLGILAIVGAAIVVAGSWLVISRTTGFMLAGLVQSFGFALVGLWLALRAGAIAGAADAPGLATLGVAAGVAMAIGFVVLPGIAMRLDDMSAAPWWVWVGFIGWLGIFILFPAWCLLLGAAIRRGGATG